jgi:transposase
MVRYLAWRRKGPLVLFNPEVKLNSVIYCSIMPLIYQFLRLIECSVGQLRSILMEDNTLIHASHYTRGYHAYHGVIRMLWPANSPDLNPIKNVWRLLKYRIGKRFPKTDEEVQRYLSEEWDKMEVSDFQKYILSMKERFQAVIDNDGGHIKW